MSFISFAADTAPSGAYSCQTTIRRAALNAIASARVSMFCGPVELDIVAYCPVPKSLSRAQRDLSYKGRIVPEPNLNNIENAVLDALKGIVYVDDAQVVSVKKRKQFASDPGGFVGLLVEVREVPEMLTLAQARATKSPPG